MTSRSKTGKKQLQRREWGSKKSTCRLAGGEKEKSQHGYVFLDSTRTGGHVETTGKK